MPDRREKRIRLLKAGLVLTAIFALFIYVDARLRPVIEEMAAHQAKVFSLKCINDAMAAEIDKQDIGYDDMVLVTQNNKGEVTSVQSNMMVINSLKVHVTQTIIDELEKRENQVFHIPIGTLIGTQFASGRGPEVEIKVIPTGYVQTSVQNKFISAGINQTLHQILLETSVQMIVIIPGYTVKTDTVTNYCVAETVIVGSVPEGYTDINGDNSSLISKVNDYATNRSP